MTRTNRCTVCGHDTWCMVLEDGSLHLCMRQASPRVYHFKDGNLGYFHGSGTTPPPIRREEPALPTVHWKKLHAEWLSATKAEWLQGLASRLGMTDSNGLEAINCCWAAPHNAWAFPMYDAYKNIMGLRLRSEEGAKWAVKGSHQGIFLPSTRPSAEILITEGPTDCVAGLQLGWFSIGRPSCSGGLNHTITFIRRQGIRRAIVMVDNDDPGIKGAEMLSTQLPIPHVMLVLPCKDLREYVQLGGDGRLLRCMIDQAVWRTK